MHQGLKGYDVKREVDARILWPGSAMISYFCRAQKLRYPRSNSVVIGRSDELSAAGSNDITSDYNCQ